MKKLLLVAVIFTSLTGCQSLQYDKDIMTPLGPINLSGINDDIATFDLEELGIKGVF